MPLDPAPYGPGVGFASLRPTGAGAAGTASSGCVGERGSARVRRSDDCDERGGDAEHGLERVHALFLHLLLDRLQLSDEVIDPYLVELEFAQRERVAGAWRMASQDIADDIRFIRQYLKVIAEKDEMLSTGTLVHSRAYVEACAGWLPQTVARYLRHLRQITECELVMTAAGIRFALSSYAWEA